MIMQNTQYKSGKKFSSNRKSAVSQRRSKVLLQDNRQSVAQLQAASQLQATDKTQVTSKKQEQSILGSQIYNTSAAAVNPIQREKISNNDNSQTGSNGIIQCIPMWKKLATGAMAVGGAAAMIGGAPLLGGAALLGSALYAGYKGYHEHQRSSTFADVNTELAAYDPATNPNVGLNPAALGRSQTILHPPLGGPGPAGPLAARQYGIDINPLDPVAEGVTSPNIIASTLTHEKTHIANDQSYDTNLARHSVTEPTNLTLVEMGAGFAAGTRVDTIIQNVEALKRTVMNDRQVPVRWRTYIRNRLDYVNMGGNPLSEYDTVINELLHFMHGEDIEADSKTAQEITRMAKENHARR